MSKMNIVQKNLMYDSSGLEESVVKDSVLHLPDVLVKCLGRISNYTSTVKSLVREQFLFENFYLLV